MRLTQKLPLLIVCIAIAASMATGLLALNQFERELRKAELSQLTALAEARGAELKRYFTTLQVTLSNLSRIPAAREAMAEFAAAFQTLALVTDGRAYLKAAFSKDHLAPLSKGEARRYAQYYRQVHREFHPWFVGNLKDRGLYDVLLIDIRGNVVYSAKKEPDFTADLNSGPLSDTGLGEVFKRIQKQPKKVGSAISDLEAYKPSNGLPSGFFAAPIFSRHGKWVGVVALQFPLRQINTILAPVAGMGATGETYLVGEDRLMRSQSRFAKGPSVFKARVDNSSVDLAFRGLSGRHLTTDYRGNKVYSAYRLLEFDSIRWVLLAEIDQNEVLARIESARASMLWIVAGIAILILLGGSYIAQRIARPIRNVADAMTALSAGDLEAAVGGKKRSDEIGRLIASFETLRKNELKRRELELEVAKQHTIAQAALDNMSQGLLMVDKNGEILARNQKFDDMFPDLHALFERQGSYEAALKFLADQGEGQLVGLNDLLHVVAKNLATSMEIEFRDSIVEIHHSPLPSHGFVQTVSDITERKQAEENTRRILEASPIGVAISKTDATLLFANSRLAEMLGTTLEDLMTRETSNNWVDLQQRQELHQELAEKQFVSNREVLLRRADGSEFWTIYSGLKFDYLGIPARMAWFYDITDRKASEDKLKDAYGIINESVGYASQIQRAALPMPEMLEHYFQDHFVIWLPRDTVGGDLYWQLPLEDGCLLAVADCTGHGVPGAFVTLIASGAIRHAISQHPEGEPDLVITDMNRFIKEILAQYTDDSESDDGLEIGICRIYEDDRRIEFAGARFSLWHWTGGEFAETRSDKTGVGYCSVPINMKLTRHQVAVNDDSRFYLFSDGMVDQIGGEKRPAYGKRRILKTLSEQIDTSFHLQAQHVLKAFDSYQGGEIRRDDVTMVGFRL